MFCSPETAFLYDLAVTAPLTLSSAGRREQPVHEAHLSEGLRRNSAYFFRISSISARIRPRRRVEQA